MAGEGSWRVLQAGAAAAALCAFYSLHSRKTISTLSSGECFVHGLHCMSGNLV